MPLLTVDSQPLHVVDRGSGPAVLLIHSFPHDHRVWDHQAEALSDSYRVITPDLPGFGQSPPRDGFGVEMAATLMLQLIESLSLTRVVIGGISMGGYITLAIAKRKPAAAAGLILADTRAAADTADARQKRSDLIELVRSGGATHVINQMLPSQLTRDVAAQQPEVLARLRKIIESQRTQSLITGTAALRDRPDYTNILPTITVPVQLIFGSQDALTPPSIADELASSLPRATVSRIPDAGHVSSIEQPQRVTDAIRGFLSSVYG